MQFLEFPGIISRGMPEALVLALVVKAILPRLGKGQGVRLLGGLPVLGFIICVGLSALTARAAGVEALLFIRHSMVFYLLFVAALNMDLTERNFRIIGAFLCLMALTQLPIGLGKFLTNGFMEGGFIGTLPRQAGSLSTIMPLFVITFLVAGYCWLGKSYYLALVPLFLLFGIFGEKRAVAFFFPIVLMVVYLTWLYDSRGRKRLLYRGGSRRVAGLAAILSLFSFAGLYLAITFLYSLNREQRIGGSFDVVYAVQEMYDYSTGINLPGEQYSDRYNLGTEALTTGRISTTLFTFADLYSGGVETFVFGRGPGLLIESQFTSGTLYEQYLEVGIRAGTTGFVWMVQQVGFLGVLFYLLLHFAIGRQLWKIYERAPTRASKAMGLALVCALFVFLMDYFAYSGSWITTGTIQPVWYLLAGRHIAVYT